MMLNRQINDQFTIRMLSGRDVQPLQTFVQETKAETKRWIPLLQTLKTEADCLQFIKHFLILFSESRGIIAGVFHDKDLVGLVSFNEVDQTNKFASIGYVLKESYRGKGLMTNVLRSFITYGFSYYAISEVRLYIERKNKASKKLATRFGFSYVKTEVHTDPINKVETSLELYRLWKQDWQT